MTAGQIDVSVKAGIGAIEINRPAKRNALTPELCDEVADAVRGLDSDPDVRAITLTGAGGDFSAGADIADLPRVLFDSSGGNDAGRSGFDHLTAADLALGVATKPTIALVQGICMGGGWQLASACDIVLCSDNAKIAITPALIGIVYPRRGVDRLVRLVGASRAKYLLYSGARVSPVDAERWGLVTALLPAAEFAAESARFVTQVAANSPYSVRTTKRLIDAGTGSEGRGGSALDAAWGTVWAEMPANPDFAAGQAAFLTGQKPEFSWH
ncbi:MAG: enoyl-CoA hydratase/isomerase family protein [Leucobacter sp.]|nr:enoyl-CoA hydratase/isomerase family protein [Leucobacter sp.]